MVTGERQQGLSAYLPLEDITYSHDFASRRFAFIMLFQTLSRYIPAYVRTLFGKMNSSDLRRRFVSGVFWSFLGSSASQGLHFVSTVLVARMLGRNDYGRLGMLRSTLQMFGVYAGFGLGMTANKHVAESHRKNPGRTGRIMALSDSVALLTGGAITAFLYLLAPWLASSSLADPALTAPLRAGAFLLLLTAINGAQSGALNGFEAFRSIAIRNTLAGATAIPFMLTGVYFWGVIGAVWGLGATMAVNVLLNQIALHREMRQAGVRYLFRTCWQERRILVHYSLPTVLSHSLVGPAMWAASAILVNTADGYSEMGTFTAAKGVNTLIMMVATTLGAPLLPMLSSLGGKTNDGLARANLLLTWMISLLFILPLMALPEMLEMVFGRQFAGMGLRQTFAIVLFYTCVMIYKQGMARVLAARGLMWWGMLSNFVWATLLLSAAWLLRSYGAIGLSMAFAIAYVGNTLLFVPFYIKRDLIPKETILSRHVGLLWALVFVTASATLLNAPIAIRGVVAGLAFAAVVQTGRRMLESMGTESMEPVKSLT
jgi:O-antigen/teichoic acid export membrane protein